MNFPIYLTQCFADSIIPYLQIMSFIHNIVEYHFFRNHLTFWGFFHFFFPCPLVRLCSPLSYSANSLEGGVNKILCMLTNMLTVLFYIIFLFYLILIPSCFKKKKKILTIQAPGKFQLPHLHDAKDFVHS